MKPILGQTVRDYAKSKEGRGFLRKHFNFLKFAAPKLDKPTAFPAGVDLQIFGTSFDNLFPLLIHRSNQGSSVRSNLNFEWLSSKQLQDFCKAGLITNVVLNETIKHAIKKQKSFA